MPFLFHSRRSTACGKADIRNPPSPHAHEHSILFFTKVKKATNGNFQCICYIKQPIQ